LSRQLILTEVERLLALSVRHYADDPELAQNALEHAWRLCVYTDTPIPKNLRLIRCTKCGKPHIPGRTAKVRLIKGKILWLPNNCEHIKQIRYK